MLNISGLQYRYGGKSVLDGVDLQVRPGEVVSLVGPNGAGKSTLLKCLNRILRPHAGSVTLDGQALHAMSRRQLAQRVAYVPQQTAAAMALNVADMVALGRAPYRGSVSAAHDFGIVADAIERFGLQALALRSYEQLSGGERQRVLLARALAQQAQFLLLDEPTSDLDLRHQVQAMSIARELARQQGAGILIAIHDLGLASRFSDRLVMLHQGRNLAQGPWQEVLTPANIATVYGIGALVGQADGMPYVIPVPA
ncbi:heme ABC transporter ATP-binding protein [Herbaspirillum autotrophicum]|uniref:heme ABC transporter ATP-binding protein n=1 Tax=Herbaspirillum autotrophicum TaxID=180195 RepID=UPI00067CC83D|nr:heme ABC transporter ATP-binding protein [Herbaspirillum autotrophicum]